MAESLTNNFLQRFKQLGAWLGEQPDIVKDLHVETFPPVSQAEIEQVQQSIGKPLPDTFLAYFKESNGYQLHYTLKKVEELQEDAGAIKIPSLKEMFSKENKIECYSQPGERTLKSLGGKDDHDLRSRMYTFDRYDEWRDEQMFNALYYAVGEDVLLYSTDYTACITDSHPITVASYMELCLAMSGLTRRAWMFQRGASGDWSTINMPPETIAESGPGLKSIQWEFFDKITPECFNLTVKFTEGKGYYLRFMKEMLARDEQFAKMGHTCDECSNLITGVRYQCTECEAYDLCEACKGGGKFHTEHQFWRLERRGV